MKSLKVHSERTQHIALDLVANINLDKVWKFSLVEWSDNRSAEQNRLMWKWNTIMGGEIGHTAKDAHEIIMREVMTPKIIPHKGESIEVYSTSILNVKEMSHYLNQYLRWAASDMGVILPLPEDQGLEAR